MTMIYHFAFHQYYALQGLRIRGEERKPECEGISMMNEEHFSILNTYWKPLQPNYAIFHIISFRIHQYSSNDDIVRKYHSEFKKKNWPEVYYILYIIKCMEFMRERERVEGCEKGEVNIVQNLCLDRGGGVTTTTRHH